MHVNLAPQGHGKRAAAPHNALNFAPLGRHCPLVVGKCLSNFAGVRVPINTEVMPLGQRPD